VTSPRACANTPRAVAHNPTPLKETTNEQGKDIPKAMIAAVYARESTEQNVGDDDKSVTRADRAGPRLRGAQGWTVAEEHIYADDGISGAEFLKRPGLNGLLVAMRSRPCPVQALITMEVSRLGREQTETAVIVREIMRTNKRRRSTNSPQRAELRVRDGAGSFAHADARGDAQQGSRGHVAGGKVYGYVNVRGADHVEREIVPTEAAVIRRIFEEIAAGRGYAKVAEGLNRAAVPCPRGRRWAMTCVREMVLRDL